MGVTIHYSGTLANPAKAEALFKESSALATELEWKFTVTDAPLASVTIYPHPDCEPLSLNPDENGLLENWVKTQFAGPEVHIQVVDFLSRIAPHFSDLNVEDEAEYWETRDRTALEGHFNRISEVLVDMQRDNPSARVQVRQPSGRIVDIIT
jgi:hypothetical protein